MNDLINECLSSARNLGTVKSFRDGKKTMAVIHKNIEDLSPKLSTTRRSIFAVAVLYYLWNSIKTQCRGHAQIIDINKESMLSEVLRICFVWIVSFQDGRGEVDNFLDVDVSTWNAEQILATTTAGSKADPTNNNDNYFDLIRTLAINWVKEIAENFNGIVRNTRIVKLNTGENPIGNADDVGRARTSDVETDEDIKSLLSKLIKREWAQCCEIIQDLPARLSPIWLGPLGVIVLHFLEKSDLSEQARRIHYTSLAWIQATDEDLTGVEALANQLEPGSVITWKKPTSGAFTKIWHKIHTSEGMKNVWEMDIELAEDTVLCHTTTCGALVEMLKESAAGGDHDTITINGRQSTTTNYTGANLVWVGVQLTEEELAAIPNTCWGKEHLINSPKKYGSVCLKFSLESVLGDGVGVGADKHAHILSTRRYCFEYSQTIIVTPFEKLFLRQHEKCDKDKDNDNQEQIVTIATPVSPLESILGHKWKIAFTNKSRDDKDWTHPELVFLGDLTIPLDQLRISFIHHVGCVGQKRCDDCVLKSATEARAKFDKLLRDKGLQDKYEIEELGDELSLKISPLPQPKLTSELSPSKKARLDGDHE